MRFNAVRSDTAIVKVGTDVITNPNGHLDSKIIASLVSQIVEVRSAISRLAIVTSGAVAAGRARYQRKRLDTETTKKKQQYASVGAYRVVSEYDKYLESHDCVASMLLVTRKELDSKIGSHHIRDTLEECFRDEKKTFPIINENDTTATEELRFTDNDQLSYYIAKLLKPKVVLFLSSINGIRKKIDEPESVITTIPFGSDDWRQFVQKGISGNGRGGAINKCRIATLMAKLGITTTIADGRLENVIPKVLLKGERTGTTFEAGPHFSVPSAHTF